MRAFVFATKEENLGTSQEPKMVTRATDLACMRLQLLIEPNDSDNGQTGELGLQLKETEDSDKVVVLFCGQLRCP